MPVGLPITLEYISVVMFSLFNFSKVFFTISEFAKPLSVTNKGFLILNVLQAKLMSLILFSPTHIVVG